MRGLKSLAAAALLAACAAPAFGQANDPAKTGVLRIGFIPAEDSRAMIRQSQDILDIVAKQTGMKIEPLSARTTTARSKRCATDTSMSRCSGPSPIFSRPRRHRSKPSP